MVISSNTTISKVFNENLVVTDNSVLRITGICTQKVSIEPNSKVIINGICDTLEVSQNSDAEIYGTVNNLINYGNVSISGIVKNLETFSKNTIIKPGAYVNDKEY